MKRSNSLCLCIAVAIASLMPVVSNSARAEDSFQSFWQKFKTAVISGDKETVASLSKFPLGMSYGIRSIKNKPDLLRRYRDVFNKQSDAAKCFAKKTPEKDAANAKRFSVACPDEAGNEVVVYQFELTRTGWKFVSLDNLNE
jgi:hypothetical protein